MRFLFGQGKKGEGYGGIGFPQFGQNAEFGGTGAPQLGQYRVAVEGGVDCWGAEAGCVQPYVCGALMEKNAIVASIHATNIKAKPATTIVKIAPMNRSSPAVSKRR